MTTQERERHPEADRDVRERLKAYIEEQVMSTLGKPGCLLQVQVRPLWEEHYRVNVFVGADAASATVAHSFFLEADGAGKIVASTPRITKCY